MKTTHKAYRTQVPLYRLQFSVIVCSDVVRTFNEQFPNYGQAPTGKFRAIAGADGHKFAIFIQRDTVTHEVIAHELFHITHLMMQFLCAEFEQESHAYIHGWITGYTYEKLAKAGVKVATKHLVV